MTTGSIPISGPQRVSILVFVELALDARRQNMTHLAKVLFQSLFSWNLLLMPAEGQECIGFSPEFQSLFSWNLLLMCGPS